MILPLPSLGGKGAAAVAGATKDGRGHGRGKGVIIEGKVRVGHGGDGCRGLREVERGGVPRG